MKHNSFRDLEAYKGAKVLITEVYLLLKKFPKEEQYALAEQLRRSAISIASNIAEGSGRVSIKEKIHFLEISFGSLMEVISQLDIATDLGYITNDDFAQFEVKANRVGALISGLKKYFKTALSKP